MTEPRRALVTGGNRGIGRAIAAALVAEGHHVTITARAAEDGAAAARALGCDWAPLDLTAPESVAGLAGRAVDILVNNAGIMPQAAPLEDPAAVERALAVMVSGPLRLIAGLAPGMAARGHGRIVNLSSGYGSVARGLNGPGAYAVAKCGLNALTQVLARDLPGCVKINAMDPGWTRTRMGGESAPNAPEDAAPTALWLATLPDDGPTGRFFRRPGEDVPW